MIRFLRRLWWMFRNRDIVGWVLCHTLICEDCDPGDFCEPHERLVNRMVREADGKL